MYRREFGVADKDSFQAMKIDYNGDLLFAGSTVAFAQNYGFEDALLLEILGARSGALLDIISRI